MITEKELAEIERKIENEPDMAESDPTFLSKDDVRRLIAEVRRLNAALERERQDDGHIIGSD